MGSPIRNWGFLLAIIAMVLVADQVTKRVVVDTVALGETIQPVPALSPYFQVTRIFNTGSAFGILPQASDLFLVIAIVVVLAMIYFYPRLEGRMLITRIAIGLVCGGALGNAFDRVQYEHVVDFIHYQIPGLFSNVSNIADHAVVFGVALMLLENWRSDRAQKRQAALADNGDSPSPDPEPGDD